MFGGLTAIAICLLAAVVGIQLLAKLVPEAGSRAVFFGGIAFGLALLSFTGFLFAAGTGLNKLSIFLTVGVLAAAAIFNAVVLKPKISGDLLPISWAGVRLAVWTLFFAWMFGRVIVMLRDGMYTSPGNNYGDLAFHFSVVTSFADGDNFPPQNPIFQGLKFTYPFMADFLTAFLHRSGASWAVAFFLPNLFLAISLTSLLELMALALTGEALAGALTPLLFYFSGGSGFLYAVKDYFNSQEGLLDFLAHLPKAYTRNDSLHLDWGNALTTLLVPQRSFMFGLPFFALIVIIWSKALVDKDQARRRLLGVTGVLAGLMPLLHSHGFFSVGLVAGVLVLLFPTRDWLFFFIPSGLIALPQALWLSGTGTRSSLFKFHPGWTMGSSPLTFWAVNLGLFLTLLAIALIIRPPRSIRFYLAFLICFVVPVTVLLAPWAWDNIKVLLYWYLVSCPLVAAALVTRRKLLWPVSASLLLALIASGGLDILRALSPVEQVQIFTREQLSAAEQMKQKLPSRALIACAPIHNSVVALTGRQLLMGYPGHLWSHGIESGSRLDETKEILRGGPDALRILSQYKVDYVVIGPTERGEFGASDSWYATRFNLIVDDSGFRVYDVKAPRTIQK